MSDFILHNYAMSPFAEKIRLMLGYTGIDWLSVAVREMPPRRPLEPLAGKYRKIPVAQIGADVFCDTRAITSEIARLSGKPELALENCSEEIQAFVRHTDLEVFLACILSAPGGTLLGKLWKGSSLLNVGRFLLDRINMGRTATVKAMGPKQAKQIVRSHLERLDTMLAVTPFLFGGTPTIADFSAYHSLWFIRDMGESKYVDRFTNVSDWMDRMAAYGHGRVTEVSAEHALDVALSAEPRALPEPVDPTASGQMVKISPDDYGQIPVTGRLLAGTDHSWIIGRDHPRVGKVNVYFPKQGFVISPC
ncbi:MAG: glutathione S-transferase family protein [Alcanivoracaceae bacterium]